ncbi:hypothetical protein C8J55DRAFT_243739 [Lentinula edodes]|uniref:Uncharacterized protein n=1 Tax=Lentinula lateritia TaxID=40482 RepID=A0A9W8ZT20_9AGAR|nr:hypothetical protein C8J55DRAFT_243739 [Lentinula edodes]
MLCVLLAGSAAASIYDVTNFSIILTSNKGASGNEFLKGDASSMFVSLAMNLAATSCIMSKAWLFRQLVKKTLSRDRVNKNVSFKILLSLVECGLFYCAVQAANGTLTVDDDAPSVLGHAIVAQFTLFFAETHSAHVISIIASQRSILESSSAVVGSHREPLTQDVEKGVGACRSIVQSSLHPDNLYPASRSSRCLGIMGMGSSPQCQHLVVNLSRRIKATRW